MDVDPIETEVDLKVNFQGHFNCQGHFVHFIDFGCNTKTIFKYQCRCHFCSITIHKGINKRPLT